jgi:hypothetical protein
MSSDASLRLGFEYFKEDPRDSRRRSAAKLRVWLRG